MLPSHSNSSMDEPAEPVFDEPAVAQSVTNQESQSGSTQSPISNRRDVRPERENNNSPLVWVCSYFSHPLLFLLAGATLLGLLGIAQRTGWIKTGSLSNDSRSSSASAESIDYICPMMCTPPQKEPGRCPVCAMELVAASTGGNGGDERSIVVDPASRRVANIETVSVRSVPLTRTIRAVGELHYDESKLKTISAYTDGRFDRLYVDFTGAVVKQGDRLAVFYSPDLYSAQIEYLQAAKSVRTQSTKTLSAVAESNRRLLENSRQRLIELGMSAEQIELVDRDGQAQSRLDIVAPMGGTVIEKVAIEGEYAKEGQPIFKLVDLSSVWLMLELFPEDAAAICYGQAVETQIKSLPGRTFSGRIAFISPEVDRNSRTVSVRVVMDNQEGILRIGDYAKATITVPLLRSQERCLVYDSELSGKWISPRHPHVISETPGNCPLSGEALVPTSLFGFSDEPQAAPKANVIPRNAVLMAADHCVVYVETEPGRFEIRRIVTGATSGDDIVVVRGLSAGEAVATNGNFLLDSQMQLAGNPSLIDPTRALPPRKMIPGFSTEMLAAIEGLPREDQGLALEQVICPVTDFKLGSMGVPPKVMVNGQPVFLCCEGCRESLLEDAEIHLKKIRKYKSGETSSQESFDDDMLPPIGEIESVLTDEDLPSIGEMKLVPQEVNPLRELKATDANSESGRILK